ncbi:MAG: protein phosphatase 2C domain-containing protein [Gemmataceae bacterium]|nr:protein phosphatase 2C domain-containing protein [Gemmataceae bacterium]
MGNAGLILQTPSWRAAAASVIGTQHEHAGGRCEDAWHVTRRFVPRVQQEVVAACVCDGAGSASQGWLGASLVSKLVSSWLVENFVTILELSKEDSSREIVAAAKRPLRRLARKSRLILREFACTVVAAAAAQDGRWVAVHVGDGGIVANFQEGLEAICLPKKGEFANETFFITDNDAATKIDIQASSTADGPRLASGFVLFTDGVESSLVNRRTMAIAPALATIFGWFVGTSNEEVSNAIEENLRGVFREKTGDDCTLAVLARMPR